MSIAVGGAFATIGMIRYQEYLMRISAIARRAPEWPVWGCGVQGNGRCRRPVTISSPHWTTVEGTLYAVEWRFPDVVSVCHYTSLGPGPSWSADYDYYAQLADPLSQMEAIMNQFPSYLMRWRL